MIHPKHLTSGKRHFAYHVCGSGEDILLIHGWLSSGRMWQSVMEHLAPHFRLWALDLSGFGDSYTDDPDLELSVDEQVNFVIDFCHAMKIRPNTILGHSMGGAITLRLALDYPDLMERLVLVCPVVTGQFNWNMTKLITNPLGRRVVELGERIWPPARYFPLTSLLIAPWYLSGDAAMRTVEDYERTTWKAAYHGLMSLCDIRLDRHLHTIRKPSLVITGVHDFTVPPRDARLAARAIRGAKLVEMTTCHHQPPDEEPERFNHLLEQFLVKQDSSTYMPNIA